MEGPTCPNWSQGFAGLGEYPWLDGIDRFRSFAAHWFLESPGVYGSDLKL